MAIEVIGRVADDPQPIAFAEILGINAAIEDFGRSSRSEAANNEAEQGDEKVESCCLESLNGFHGTIGRVRPTNSAWERDGPYKKRSKDSSVVRNRPGVS